MGTLGSFTVSATGTAPITFTESGALPTGVTFVSNGASTATLSGSPGAGTSGVYPITITASNGTSPNATQAFTLNVWASVPACNAWDSITAPSGATSASFSIAGAGGGGGGFGGSGSPGAGAAGELVNATYTVGGGQTLWVDLGCGGGGGADGTGAGNTSLSGQGAGGTGAIAGGLGGGWYTNASGFYAGAGGGGGGSTVVCLQPASGGSSNCGTGDTELSIASGGGGGGGTTCSDSAGAGGVGGGGSSFSGTGYSGDAGSSGANEQSGGNGTDGGTGGSTAAGAGGKYGSNNSAGTGGTGGGSPTGTGGAGGQQANSGSKSYGSGGGGGGAGWTGGGGGGANSCTGSDGGSGGGGAGASWASTTTGGTGIAFDAGTGTSTTCGQSTAVGATVAGGLGGAASTANGANAYAGCAGSIALSWVVSTASPTVSVSAPATDNAGTAITGSSISAGSPTPRARTPPAPSPSSSTDRPHRLRARAPARDGRRSARPAWRAMGPIRLRADSRRRVAGEYWWYASYGGDSHNNPESSPCPSITGTTVNASPTNDVLEFVGQPADAFAGVAMSSPVTVQVEDQYGNNVTTSGTSVTLGLSSGTITSPTTALTSSGLATFNGVTIGSTGLGLTLSASSTGMTTATSDAFNVSVLVANGAVLSDPPASDGSGSGVQYLTYYYCSGFVTSCTSATPWAQISPNSNSTNPYSVTWTSEPSDGQYSVVTVGTDNVDNVSVASAPTPVTVDNGAPTLTITTSGSNPYYSGSGATLYYAPNGSGSFTVTATDPVSGIASTTFPAAPTGWTKSTGTDSATYTRSSATASSALTGVSATNGAGDTTTENVTITVDSAAPANNLSLSNQVFSGSFLSGTTVYYHGSVAGAFAVANGLTDSGSGPASSSFPTLGGSSTGWTHTADVETSGPPYVSNMFTWTANATTSPTEAVVGSDNVGNTATTTLTFVNDSTAPAGGALMVNGISATSGGSSSTSSATGFSIESRSNYTDSGSGLASSSLTVQSETLTNGTCGARPAQADRSRRPRRSAVRPNRAGSRRIPATSTR